MNKFIPNINLNLINGCCIECIISKLYVAKYFNDIDSMKIILDHLYYRFTNKTHDSDNDLLDIKIKVLNNKNVYKISYIFLGKIQTEEFII